MTMGFEPAQPEQFGFVAYGSAPIPDPRDLVVDRYIEEVRRGGQSSVAGALSQVSEAARRVLRVFAERSASRAVREASVDRLVSALVAVVLGGLDENALEAMMPMALIEDAGRRIGVEAGAYFGTAADIVGHPASVNLMMWLTRKEEDRTPEAMGFTAVGEGASFRYGWVM
jgi:hypothetical protein